MMSWFKEAAEAHGDRMKQGMKEAAEAHGDRMKQGMKEAAEALGDRMKEGFTEGLAKAAIIVSVASFYKGNIGFVVALLLYYSDSILHSAKQFWLWTLASVNPTPRHHDDNNNNDDDAVVVVDDNNNNGDTISEQS